MAVDVDRTSPATSSCAATTASRTPGSTGSSTGGSPTGPPRRCSGPRPSTTSCSASGSPASAAGRSRSAPAGTAGRSGRSATDALVIDLGWPAGDVVRRRDRHRQRLPGGPGRRRAGAVPRRPRPLLPRRHCPTVGIGGFLLQGGQGWNARGWGWAAEYVEAIDVVTADGELVRADADAERRPLLGRPRRRARLLRRRHPLPPAHAARTRARRPDRAGLRPRRLRRGDDLAARDARTRSRDTVEIVALTKTDRALSPEPGAAGHRARAGRRRGRGRRGAGAVPRQPRARPRADGGRRRADHARRAARAPARGQPRGPPLGGRQRLADRLRPTRCVPAMRRAYTTLPNDKAFTIWFSMAPLRELPDMAFSLQSEIYLASYVLWEDPAEDERARGLAAARRWPTSSRSPSASTSATATCRRRQVEVLSDDALGPAAGDPRAARPRRPLRRLPRRTRRGRQPQPLGVDRSDRLVGERRRRPRRAGRRTTGAPGRPAGRGRTSSPRPAPPRRTAARPARAGRPPRVCMRASRSGTTATMSVPSMTNGSGSKPETLSAIWRSMPSSPKTRSTGVRMPGPKVATRVRQRGQVLERERRRAGRGCRGPTSSTIRSRHSGRDSPGKPKPSGAISAS